MMLLLLLLAAVQKDLLTPAIAFLASENEECIPVEQRIEWVLCSLPRWRERWRKRVEVREDP